MGIGDNVFAVNLYQCRGMTYICDFHKEIVLKNDKYFNICHPERSERSERSQRIYMTS